LLSRLTLTPTLGPIKESSSVNMKSTSKPHNDISEREYKCNKNAITTTRVHNHVKVLQLMLETIRPLGRSKFYILGLLVPSIIARLKAMLVAIEGRTCIINLIMKYDNDVNDDHGKNMKFKHIFDDVNDDDQDSNVIIIPPAPLMLEALTPRLAKEAKDSERLELVGDSLLKFVTTVELYKKYPDENEGFLTINRSTFVSNLHLYESAIERKLQKYIHCNVVSSGKQNLQIRPAGMTLQGTLLKKSLWNKNISFGCIGPSLKKRIKKKKSFENYSKIIHEYTGMEEEDDDNLILNYQHIKKVQDISESLYFSKYIYSINNYEKFTIKPKIISDMTEAIIGAFFVSGGVKAAISVIKAIGSWPKRELEVEESIFKKSKLIIPDEFPIELRKYVEFNYNNEKDNNLVEQAMNNNSSVQIAINIIANKIGYKFKDKNLLLESLTHSSVKTRRNYERLEFLGDAVLDFAVVSTLFKYQPFSSQVSILIFYYN
jgi:dsRNA-specific ribonuclease